MRSKLAGWAWVFSFLCLPNTAWSYGEASDGSPNHSERLLHVLTNQLRQEPHAWPGWDTNQASNTPRRPLALHSGLLRAARFHAEDMAEHGCFSHESCDGTSFRDRLGRFFQGSAGENIYVVVGNDDPSFAITAWMGSEGHRANLLREDWTHLGTGFAQQNAVFYVQDFGRADDSEISLIPGAAIQETGADRLRLIANFFDRAGRSPQAFEGVLDGVRIMLAHRAGSPGNETWDAEVLRPSACVSLIFAVTAEGGESMIFPTTGSLLVGPECSSSFQGEQDEEEPSNEGCRTGGRGQGEAWVLILGMVTLIRRKFP